MAYRNQNPSGRRPQRMTASADTAQEARVDVFRWPSMYILRSSVLPPWLHPSHHVASCACRVRDKEPLGRVPVAERVRMSPRYRVLEFLHSKLCDRARRRELPSDSEERCVKRLLKRGYVHISPISCHLRHPANHDSEQQHAPYSDGHCPRALPRGRHGRRLYR